MARLPRIRLALVALACPLAANAQEPGDPPGRVGRISSVFGTVAFQAAGLGDWSVAPLNYTVTSGDRLMTARGARTEMEVGPFAVRLADSTDLSVIDLTDDFAQIGLTHGTLRVSVYRLSAGDSMEIDTPNGALLIRSAGRYRVDVPLGNASTLVSVDEGRLEMTGPGMQYTLTRGQAAELTGTNPIHAAYVARPRSTEFDEWSADRDRRHEASDCSLYVSRDMPGCADLSEHGRWDRHPEYGHVWRPVHVAVDWVPYRYGRWVWTGPWGWTWVEDSPWGFAPFHYGRWVTVAGAWVWAPGPIVRRPCYAPALVVFIGGPRYGTYFHAWFPLGPREPYFPRYRHSDRYLRQVNITNVRHVTNVDVFVDARRADRLNYANKDRGLTAVPIGTFGHGRPVLHDAVNIRPDEVNRAPMARSRWDAPATSTPAEETRAPIPFQPRRRTSLPQAPEETRPVMEQPRYGEPDDVRPRERTPLISRNTPAPERRAETVFSRRPDNAIPRSPVAEEPTPQQPVERRPSGWRVDPRERPVAPTPERSRAPEPQRAPESRPSAPAPRERSAPPRAESRPSVGGGQAPRIPTRSRPPD